MDYSLVVGVDSENQELVVGIVGMFSLYPVVCDHSSTAWIPADAPGALVQTLSEHSRGKRNWRIW